MHEVFDWVGGLLKAVLFYVTARAITLLPVRLLTRLGAWIAETRPLGRYAGWRFAIEESNATVPVRIRRLLWDYFKEKGFQHPVRVKWFHSLKLDLVLGNDQSRCLYVGGSFEPNEFALLADVLRPGMVVVDAGANEGFYSVFMATRVGGDGQVIAVEPSPRERARLERNVTINNLRNVHVVNCGLAAHCGRAVLHIADAEHNGQNTLGHFVYEGVTTAADLEIELQSLDALIEKYTVRRLDLIKMDVEGAELGVLLGAERVLRQFRPLILFELLDDALRAQNTSGRDLLDFLTHRGYSIFKFEMAGTLSPLRDLAEASSNLLAVPSNQLEALRRISGAAV